jgi:hypothetical protein
MRPFEFNPQYRRKGREGRKGGKKSELRLGAEHMLCPEEKTAWLACWSIQLS